MTLTYGKMTCTGSRNDSSVKRIREFPQESGDRVLLQMHIDSAGNQIQTDSDPYTLHCIRIA